MVIYPFITSTSSPRSVHCFLSFYMEKNTMCPECHIFSTTGAFLIAKSWTQPMVALRHDPTSVLPHMGWRQSSCHAMVMKTLESLRHFVGREPPGMSHPIASDRNVGGMERQPCCSEIVVYVSVYIYVCVSILENRQVKRLFIPPIQFLFFSCWLSFSWLLPLLIVR
jgi:hypothetical protein